MDKNNCQDSLDRDKFRKMIYDEMKNIWGIQLDSDGDFHCDVHADYRDEISDEDIKKICMCKNPEIAFDEWIEKSYDDSKEKIRTDIVYKIARNLEEELGDNLSEEQKTWLRDFVRYYVSFNLPDEHFLKQKVLADVFVDTGDSAYSFSLNSRFLSGAEIPSSGQEKKPSIVWLAETQGYSEKQLKAVLTPSGSKVGNSNGSSNFIGANESFLRSMRQTDYPMFASPLVFLVELTVGDLIQINSVKQSRVEERSGKEWTKIVGHQDYGALHISRETAVLLFDPWFTGAGSSASLDIEKNIDIPLEYVYSALPDGLEGKYSIKSVYAMQDNVWKTAAVNTHAELSAEHVSVSKLDEFIEAWENDPKSVPKGRYWARDVDDVYIAVDNSTGDAWTEEFDTSEECMSWLTKTAEESSSISSSIESRATDSSAASVRNSMRMKR